MSRSRSIFTLSSAVCCFYPLGLSAASKPFGVSKQCFITCPWAVVDAPELDNYYNNAVAVLFV